MQKKDLQKELRKCPFCKHDALIVTGRHHRHGTKIYYGECNVCGTESEACDSKEEAIRIWNTRPIEYGLEVENERLRKALCEIAELRNLNSNLKHTNTPSCAEDIFANFYCVMGDIAIKALNKIHKEN